jgi:hypothetical protein
MRSDAYKCVQMCTNAFRCEMHSDAFMCRDAFRCVQMHTDAFRCIQMGRDAFRCVEMRSDAKNNFEGFVQNKMCVEVSFKLVACELCLESCANRL